LVNIPSCQSTYERDLAAIEDALHLPSAVRHYWSNTERGHGVFFNRAELEMLLSRIGLSPAWDWVRVETDLPGGRWAQSCGDAERGLIVEVNGPDLIARRSAARAPRPNVGTSTWPYYASEGELHTVVAAAAIHMGWIEGGTIGSTLERRAPDPQALRRD
jgi:hypothetical protein